MKLTVVGLCDRRRSSGGLSGDGYPSAEDQTRPFIIKSVAVSLASSVIEGTAGPAGEIVEIFQCPFFTFLTRHVGQITYTCKQIFDFMLNLNSARNSIHFQDEQNTSNIVVYN